MIEPSALRMNTEPSPAERNRLNIEEALASLTHRCRFLPGLRLKPEHCELRKSRKQKIANQKDYSVFRECSQCPGPVPWSGAENRVRNDPSGRAEKPSEPKPSAESARPSRRKRTPERCNRCGKGPEETRFYSSRPERCAACIEELAKERKEEERSRSRQAASAVEKVVLCPEDGAVENVPTETGCGLEYALMNWKEEPLSVDKAMQELESSHQTPPEPSQGAEGEAPLYFCATHGLHSGRVFGRFHSKICPQCHRERMSTRMKEASKSSNKPESKETAPALPAWVSAWCAQKAAEEGIGREDYLIRLVAAEIPPEWAKEWLVKGDLS
jgi:hypothetical protein